MNIIENLTCKHCNNIYKDPAFLSCCGKHICKRDINKLLSKTSTNFLCPLCDSEVNKNEKFQINETLKVLIEEAELHKLKINPDYINTFKSFKDKIASFENMHNDPLNLIYENIAELKREVDLDRETVKAEIDALADDMHKTLNSYAAQFKKESKSKKFILYYDKMLSDLKNDLNEYEQCLKSLSFTDEDRKNKTNHFLEAINVLDTEKIDYKTKLFNYKSIVYEPMKAKIGDIFGKLIVS